MNDQSGSLSNLTFPTRSVPYNGADIRVRGLTMDDISTLCRSHRQEIDGLAARHLRGEAVDTSQVLRSVVARLPRVAAQIIALANDSPDQIDKAQRLPAHTQLELLRAVYELTVEDAGGLKKLVEILEQVIRDLNLTAEGMILPVQTGSIN